MKLIIEIEAATRPERPYNDKYLTVISRSMRIETDNNNLEPSAIAKTRHNAAVLMDIAAVIDNAVSPLCRPTPFPPSDPHRALQKDDRSRSPDPDEMTGK